MSQSERRRTPRRTMLNDHEVVSARIRPGHPARLIDVSAGGALVETPHRLLPGRAIELQIDSRNRHATIRGSVVRCTVVRVRPTAVSYRGAIAFDQHVPWFAESAAPDGYEIPARGPRATRERADVTQSTL